jgi:hypothetical protein
MDSSAWLVKEWITDIGKVTVSGKNDNGMEVSGNLE